jgi:uncharacterized protein (TIGR03503 family)
MGFIASTGPFAAPVLHEPVDDVRILIDISGSMKRTDPGNLRAPALRLFVSLLPTDTRAGVWTFGQWVNMLIPHGPVDANWKIGARVAAGEIHSHGLYTNIEDALRRASWDWQHPDPQARRNLILLTDGLVDIAESATNNTASRQRILEELLPRLQQAGATLHTIALSQESDHNLMRQLAAATGGWFETIETTDGLERLFLRMFEQVARTDSLPLTNNRVKIDASIKEITFLIFRGDGTKATHVITPSGRQFDRQHLSDGMQWHQESRYDLITIQKPEVGNWKIDADIDPDNRIIVVTDLRLKTTHLPAVLSATDSIVFTAHLEEKGDIITRRDLLHFVRMKLKQSDTHDKQWKFRLKDDGKGADRQAHDGIYSAELKNSLIDGEHEIELVANGTTFKRYARQLVKIHSSPVDAQIEFADDNTQTLVVTPYQGLIDANAMRVEAEHQQPDGKTKTYRISRTSPAEWKHSLDSEGSIGTHQITLHITGTRIDGSPVDILLPPLIYNIGKSTPQDTFAEKSTQTTHDNKILSTDWFMVSIQILTFNLFLATVAFFSYQFWPSIQQKLIPHPCKV